MHNPPKPLLVYDGACAFCRMWIDRWKQLTGDAVLYAPSSDAARDHPQVPPETFRKSVVFIREDGSFTSGARAALSALASGGGTGSLLRIYEKFPPLAALAEQCYAAVAGHRDEMYLVTRVLWGKTAAQPGFAATRWIFLRGMGLIYLVAFYSLRGQIAGLVGPLGISPADLFLGSVHAQIGDAGLAYYPTLAWIDASESFLRGLCTAGMVCSVLLLAGILPRMAAALLWVLYSSLCTAGQVFLSFQSDALLLEAGFLTVFIAPFALSEFRAGTDQPRPAWRWLLWLLLFRLMFMSGVAKLTGGDPAWWNLTALSTYFESQVLPAPPAWYAHLLPLWFTRLSVLIVFVVEIGVPLLMFTPRRLRHLGAFLMILLQVLIMVTGNYGFYNLLTILLCVTLLDDGVTAGWIPGFLKRPPAGAGEGRPVRRRRIGVAAVFTLAIILNILQVAGAVIPRAVFPRTAASFSRLASHFHLVNGYGLPGVRTGKRPEIIIEGSNDGETWTAYEFKYKPGVPSRTLPWVAPHQPRLDARMGSAAAGDDARHEWFVNFCIRLLEGSPDVLRLLGDDPFPGGPPRYVRALLYEYRFAAPGERETTGDTWVRTLNSTYLSPISLGE